MPFLKFRNNNNMTQKNSTMILLAAAFMFLVVGTVFLSGKRPEPTPPPPLSAPRTILTSPAPSPEVLPGALTLQTSTPTVANGETVTVTVALSAPQTSVEGADAVVTFDDSLLRFVEASPSALFDQYPRAKLYKDAQVVVTGYQSETPLFSPADELVTLTFRAIASGSATVTLDPDRSKITESATAKNVAGSFGEAIIQITNF